MCTCTAVKHSQESIRHKKKAWRRRNESLEDGTKTRRSPHLSRNRLPPAISSNVICFHQTYTGMIPTAYNNILKSQLLEELRGPHTMCKVILVPGASRDWSMRDGASRDLRGRQGGPDVCELWTGQQY